MQTYSSFWYAGASLDFVWQAATSLKVDRFEAVSTPGNNVIFRFGNIIDNGYDEGILDKGTVGETDSALHREMNADALPWWDQETIGQHIDTLLMQRHLPPVIRRATWV